MHWRRHRLVPLTGACRNLRRAVSIREAVEEETKEAAEVTEETAHDLPERGRAKHRREKRRLAERGQSERGRAEKGRLERGRAERDQAGRGRAGRGRAESEERPGESPSHRAQQRSPVHNTLLLEEGERLQHPATSRERRNHSLIETASSFCLEGGMPALRRSEGATVTSISSGERHKLRIDSELLTLPCRPSARSALHAIVPQGQENVMSYPRHLQLGTRFPCSPPFSYVETRDWRFGDVLEGPTVGVLETGGGEYERHASEGMPVDVDSNSAAAPGEEERSPGAPHAVQREEETQHWKSRKVLGTGGSEYEHHASEGVLVIGTSEEVPHSRSAVATTREGVVKGGLWTFVQAPVLGDDEGEEEPVVEARVCGDEKGREPMVEGGEVTVGIQMDLQRKDGDSSPTRCVEEQGDRASVLSTGREMVVHEAIELGNDSAATELVSNSGMTEVHNVESSMEGGEVTVSVKMDPERKDHDSPFTRCGEEQGDRVSVLSTGREMVLHEAIDLPSD
ncbi:hypothetical protein CBR_g50620 [Chara braunii]|uniref:Uncharacterized protein n=1 Tax=Chara braunii TaxID=69332 RepID=A0A388M7E1_CHABU|nr:hypothetical protein CBR_g50620 [Chara braunii]|eukprot:GBG90372.1 hypothetical protein CBR_g50620 [Chara braunii]